MIKILFFIHDLGPGGAEKVLVNLVNNMDKKRFDITVMALFGGGINEQFLSRDVNYRVIFKKTFPMNSHIMKLFSPRRLHKAFIREKYDIEVSYLEGPCARIISGCPNKDTRLVSWIHIEQHNKKTAAGAFRSYRESVACYHRFDTIITVSDYVRHDFQSIYPELADLKVLYNTIETEMILSLMNKEVSDTIFLEEEFKICGVGKIIPKKGFMKLARIHKRLIDQGYPVHTYILGEGAERSRIEKYLKDRGLEETFTFLGYQLNPYKYVAKCDVFVCTSSAEGFSTAATEAIIVNTPVITTPVSGMEELLGEDPCGVICGPDEEDLYLELKKWVRNPMIKDYYKQKTKERAKQFSQEETVQRVEEFFCSLMDSSEKRI